MGEKKEYIERGAALLAITGQPSELHYPSWYKGNIMEVPAADVVEVVRCKNCKHAQRQVLKKSGGFEGWICEYDQEHFIAGDHFCSCGERKEE